MVEAELAFCVASRGRTVQEAVIHGAINHGLPTSRVCEIRDEPEQVARRVADEFARSACPKLHRLHAALVRAPSARAIADALMYLGDERLDEGLGAIAVGAHESEWLLFGWKKVR